MKRSLLILAGIVLSMQLTACGNVTGPLTDIVRGNQVFIYDMEKVKEKYGWYTNQYYHADSSCRLLLFPESMQTVLLSTAKSMGFSACMECYK